MGDVAQILGVENEQAPPGGDIPRQQVADLMTGGPTELPPIVPTNSTASTKRIIVSSGRKARKWAWAPFSSSSRTDGLLLHHWVRANVEYPDYPYARFDIHLDPVTYSSDKQYADSLQDPNWSKSETDQLLEFAKRYELRWPVIYDRWCEHFDYFTQGTPEFRRIEDLQHRYYAVAAILLQTRITHEATTEADQLAKNSFEPADIMDMSTGGTTDDGRRTADTRLIETAAARALATAEPKNQPLIPNIGTGATNKVPFDLNYERKRRDHLERLWNRTKEEEEEETALRQELKQVEAQLRKLKKSGAHQSARGSAASSRAPTPVQDLSPAAIDKAFSSTAPVPVPGTPYLQSARLVPPAVGGQTGLSRILMSKLQEMLFDMNIPDHLLPTKKVCDLYDKVRKDVITLLVLQKSALHKEGLLQSKRLALGRRGGNEKVVDEETLIGIEPPASDPLPPASTVARVVNPKGQRPVNKTKVLTKPKSPAGEKKAVPSVITAKVASVAPVPPATTKTTKKTATAVKRKRKSDASKSPTAAVAAAAAEVVQKEAKLAAAAALAQATAGVGAPPVVPGDSIKPPGKKRTKKSG